MATHVALMRDGRLIGDGPLPALLDGAAQRIFLRTGDDAGALELLRTAGVDAGSGDGGILVAGGAVASDRIARQLVANDVAIHELTPRRMDLETLYLSWTRKAAA